MPLKAARARKAAAEPPLMLDVLKQFRVLLRAMESHYRQVERRSGLGGAQLWALAEIAAADLTMGDLIVALSSTPADATSTHYVLGEPHAPTADWELVHGAVHHAKTLGKPVRVGGVVSSDVFYNPDSGQYQRWSDRGVLAVEMEAAILFTLGALRKVQAGCLLIVSDIVVEGEFTRITDEEMRAAVDRMTRVALATVTSE